MQTPSQYANVKLQTYQPSRMSISNQASCSQQLVLMYNMDVPVAANVLGTIGAVSSNRGC